MSPRVSETVATFGLCWPCLLFLGCVPSLVLVDLFLVTVASGEKRRSSDVHLGVGVEQVPFIFDIAEN